MDRSEVSLQIGLVGVGPWGAHILRDLRTLGAEVHAVARSRESIQRADAGGATTIVDAPDALPSCDGYVVANRTTSHLDAIEALLPRARPIFCEKPIGVDVDRTNGLPREAHDFVFIMHKWRYHPGILELARLAASGEFGPVEGLRTYRLGWGNPHADVGSLWVLAPHDLSIALTILGEVPILLAAARDPTDRTGALAYMRTSSGVPVLSEVSFGHPKNLRRIMVRCRDALCQLDDSDYRTVTIHCGGDAASRHIRVSEEMPLLAELRAFVEHVRGGPPPGTSLADELKIIEVLAQVEDMISAQ